MPDSPSAVVGPGGGKDVGICRPKDTRGGHDCGGGQTSGEGCVGDGEDFKVDAMRNGEAAKVRKETGVMWTQEREYTRRRAAAFRKY